MSVDHATALREWARGMYTSEAATELLLRALNGHYAVPGLPWVKDRDNDGYWIDFDAIPDNIGAYSGGEQRVLRIAASLGGGVPVDLGENVSGLDRAHIDLVLAAISHASGAHEHSHFGDRLVPLHPWPDTSATR